MKGINPNWLTLAALFLALQTNIATGNISLHDVLPEAWVHWAVGWAKAIASFGVLASALLPQFSSNKTGTFISDQPVITPYRMMILAFAGILSMLLLMPDARAADVNKAPVNIFAGGYSVSKCGAYYGINSFGSGGTVNGAAVGTQIVQGNIGVTVGYGCPIAADGSSFWFAEGMFDFANVNGNANGLSLSGPATFIQRVGVGSPLNVMLGSLPGLPSNPAVPNLPLLPNGVTAGPAAPYLFAAIHEQDVSAQLGLLNNKQWLISPGIGIGMLYRLSNGVVADTFAEYKLSSNSLCFGPLGSGGCAKLGPAAVLGVQFKY